MEDSLSKLRILSRAEAVLFRMRLKQLTTQLTLITVGLFLLLLTVVMVNLAAYQYLVERFASYQAALIIALINGALAGLLIVVALKTGRGHEAGVAEELRDLAWNEVQNEANQLWRSVTDLRTDASAIRSAFQAWGSGGANLLLGHLLQAALHALALFRGRK